MLKLSTVITASACALCAVALAATQEVAVETVDANGSMVLDAVCDLVNQNGSWRVTTPGTIPINAGGDWLTVKCAKGFDLIGSITSFSAGRPLAARRSPVRELWTRKPEQHVRVGVFQVAGHPAAIVAKNALDAVVVDFDHTGTADAVGGSGEGVF